MKFHEIPPVGPNCSVWMHGRTGGRKEGRVDGRAGGRADGQRDSEKNMTKQTAVFCFSILRTLLELI
jgi:hypothetical protein